MKDISLGQKIDKEVYDRKNFDLEYEQKKIEERFANFERDNEQIIITLKYLLEFVSKVDLLYQSSGIEKKRRILKLIFPNFYLDGSNLLYEIKKPFDEFIKKADCIKTWVWWDSNPRPID